MIENLLPESIGTLRALYRSVYADRPAILAALEKLLDDLLDELWPGDGMYTASYERVNRELLPLLLDAADVSPEPPVLVEERVSAAWRELRRIAATLEHP